MNFIKNPEELKKILDDNNPDLVLIDVRTPEEFSSSHIKGAVNINIYNPNFSSKIKDLDPEKKYIVYCRSGNRSLAAYQQMNTINLKVNNCIFGMMSIDGSVLEIE